MKIKITVREEDINLAKLTTKEDCLRVVLFHTIRRELNANPRYYNPTYGIYYKDSPTIDEPPIFISTRTFKAIEKPAVSGKGHYVTITPL